MPQLVTRCPHCKTSFHISRQQLGAARGMVRCGFCLRVFTADAYLQLARQTAEAAPPGVQQAAPDDSGQSGEPEPCSVEATADTGTAAQTPHWSFSGSDAVADGPVKGSDTDESTSPAPAPKAGDHSVPGSEAPKAKAVANRLIAAIEPAPLQVRRGLLPRRTATGWLWGLAALLLLLALIVQVAILQFDRLNKREPWRRLYAVACSHLNCQLPPREDLSKIRTINLVVRSHPQIANALLVEAVLLNRAPFPQPFPALQLSFSDLKNTPVASRRFEPRDYLRGELAGRRQMPQNSPVQFAIDIVDPGPSAVNYQLLITP